MSAHSIPRKIRKQAETARVFIPRIRIRETKEKAIPIFRSLNPGSKYFFNKLAAKGEKFGRVIALCTPETLKGVSFTVSGTDVSYENVSAYELFRRRMTAFLGNDDAETDIFVEELVIEPTRFDTELTIYGGRTRLTVTLASDTNNTIKPALRAAFADLDNGFIAVGGLTAVGRGLFGIDKITLNGNDMTYKFKAYEFKGFFGGEQN